MKEILTFLATHLAFMLDGRYRLVDSRVGPSFGGDAFLVLESAVLRVRLSWDRSELQMDFQPIDWVRSEWFSPGLLKGVLTGDRGGSEVLDENWGPFLETGLAQLESRLVEPDLRASTIDALRREARRRAKELLG